jgi:hypothetical protein
VLSHLATTVKHAILCRTMLDAANSDKRLLSAFQDTVEAQAFVVVRFSLMQSLLMQTARCWDRKKDDRASLPHLADLLQAPGAVNALAERAAGRSPGMDHGFRDRLAELRRDIRKHSFGEREKRRRRVFGYRDHLIAHSLTSPPAYRAVDDDVFTLLDETVPLVEKAYSTVLGHRFQVAEWHRVNAEYARRFWASVRAGQVLMNEKRRAWGGRRAPWLSGTE